MNNGWTKRRNGRLYHEPPYTRKEQREFRRRIDNGGPMIVVHGSRTLVPPPREKPPQKSPPQLPEE
jgi:hypothetical protein